MSSLIKAITARDLRSTRHDVIQDIASSVKTHGMTDEAVNRVLPMLSSRDPHIQLGVLSFLYSLECSNEAVVEALLLTWRDETLKPAIRENAATILLDLAPEVARQHELEDGLSEARRQWDLPAQVEDE